uniref:Uncharacterized protein n=1 Tax=Hubei narna-like virus 20 TaxID=1922951 RepID=A0A1L3KIC2_9VIRU|nr:hypothetical protein [Hubei narna-like virus 20]
MGNPALAVSRSKDRITWRSDRDIRTKRDLKVRLESGTVGTSTNSVTRTRHLKVREQPNPATEARGFVKFTLTQPAALDTLCPATQKTVHLKPSRCGLVISGRLRVVGVNTTRPLALLMMFEEQPIEIGMRQIVYCGDRIGKLPSHAAFVQQRHRPSHLKGRIDIQASVAIGYSTTTQLNWSRNGYTRTPGLTKSVPKHRPNDCVESLPPTCRQIWELAIPTANRAQEGTLNTRVQQACNRNVLKFRGLPNNHPIREERSETTTFETTWFSAGREAEGPLYKHAALGGDNRLGLIYLKAQVLHRSAVARGVWEQTDEIVTPDEMGVMGETTPLDRKLVEETECHKGERGPHMDTPLRSDGLSVREEEVPRTEHLIRVIAHPFWSRNCIQDSPPKRLRVEVRYIVSSVRKITTNAGGRMVDTMPEERLKALFVRHNIHVDPLLLFQHRPELTPDNITRQEGRSRELYEYPRFITLLGYRYHLRYRSFCPCFLNGSLYQNFIQKFTSLSFRRKLQQRLNHRRRVGDKFRQTPSLASLEVQTSGILIRSPIDSPAHQMGPFFSPPLAECVKFICDVPRWVRTPDHYSLIRSYSSLHHFSISSGEGPANSCELSTGFRARCKALKGPHEATRKLVGVERPSVFDGPHAETEGKILQFAANNRSFTCRNFTHHPGSKRSEFSYPGQPPRRHHSDRCYHRMPDSPREIAHIPICQGRNTSAPNLGCGGDRPAPRFMR